MNDKILHAILATYQDETSANEAHKALLQATKEGQFDIHDSALIFKDADGTIHVKDTADVSTGKGAAIGGIIGGVLGLIAGPAGAVILGGTGAAIGGAITRGDEGLPDERLYELGEKLEAGTAAVVVVVNPAWVSDVEAQLAASASNVTTKELSPEISAQLLGEESADDSTSAD